MCLRLRRWKYPDLPVETLAFLLARPLLREAGQRACGFQVGEFQLHREGCCRASGDLRLRHGHLEFDYMKARADRTARTPSVNVWEFVAISRTWRSRFVVT